MESSAGSVIRPTWPSPRTGPHVLQVFQPQIGGVPRYTAALAHGLLLDGWRVSVACSRQAESWDELAAAGVELLPMDVPRSPSPWTDARAIRSLVKWCRECDVSLIHGHSTKAGMLAALAGRGADLPSIYTPHGWSFDQLVLPPVRALYAAFERQMVRRYHACVLTVSASGRDAGRRWGVVSQGGVHVVHTGLPPLPNMPRTVAREELGLGPDVVVAAWVGRTGPQKRPQDLVQIARRLGQQVTVVALCHGADGPTLGAELREAGVKLVDPHTPPQVLYAAADIMLHTSAWEASPLVILEAMAYKLPVVAYDVGGVPEQVRAGRTGYLVAPCDVEMLCECVLTLARKPQLREQMGLAGLGRIKTQFSHGAMLDRIARVYMTIAGKSAAEAPVERHAPSRSWEGDPGLVRGVA